MKHVMRLILVGITSAVAVGSHSWAGGADDRAIHFSGNAQELQQVIDQAANSSTIKGATFTGPVVQQKDCQDVTIIHVTD